MAFLAILLSLTLFLLGRPVQANGCFNPDGSDITGEQDKQQLNAIWVPCNQVQGLSSGCCITNRTTDLGTTAPDSCLANGLCSNFNTWPNGSTTDLYWAPLCSDKHWKSPYCLPDLCKGVAWSGLRSRPALANCSNDMWCCSPDDDQSCCNDASKKFKLAEVVGVSTTATAPFESSTATATGSVRSTTPSSSAGDRGGLSAGAIAGIVIGILAIIAIGGAVGFWAWRRKPRSSRNQQQVKDPDFPELQGKAMLQVRPSELQSAPAAPGSGSYPGKQVWEAPGDQSLPPIELDASNVSKQVTGTGWQHR